MRETIQKMLDAEAEAKRLLADAEAEAERIRVDARKRAQETVEHSRKEGAGEAAKVVDAAVREADEERAARLKEATARIEAETKVDPALHRQAVDAIVGVVCGKA